MARRMLSREDSCVSGFRGDIGGEKGGKPGAFAGQSIQVGAGGTAIAVTRKVVGPEGIGDDQQGPQVFTPGAWRQLPPFSEPLDFW